MQACFKNYKEWTFIHKINVSFKDNKNLNERWDNRNHLFYKQVLSGALYQKDNMVSKDNKIHKELALNIRFWEMLSSVTAAMFPEEYRFFLIILAISSFRLSSRKEYVAQDHRKE